MRRAREPLVLIGACLAVYLMGSRDVPFYTRGEPREGLVVREMLRTGAWLVPARPDRETARKPPLYYWTAAVALRALPSRPELALRLPSALLATGAVLATWALARAMAGPAAGLPAAVVLATSFEWIRAASTARVDMPLAAALTVALTGWTLALAGRGLGWTALGALGAGAAVLAKGPVGLVLPALALSVLALARRDRAAVWAARPIGALGAAALVAGLWYVVAAREQGGAFVATVARENWLRFVDTEAAGTGHGHGPAYLFALGLIGLLPWTPLLPLAIVPVRTGTRWARFVAGWAAATLVFFSVAAAKRSVYLLPAFPAVAVLLGAGVAEASPPGRIVRVARAVAWAYVPAAIVLALLGIAVATGFGAASALTAHLRPDDATAAAALLGAGRGSPLLVVAALVTAAAAVVLAQALGRTDWRMVVFSVAALTAGWVGVFDLVVHPAVARSRSLATFMAEVGRLVPEDATLYAFFPPDPGLRFYAPRALRPWPDVGLSAPSALLLWEDEWRQLRDGAGEPLPPRAVSEAGQAGRGHLLLVTAPPGRLARVRPEAAPNEPAGLRMDSRRR